MSTDPDGVAVVVDGVAALTYREWDTRSTALGRGLLRCPGARSGARVVLVFDNAGLVDFACTYAAVEKAAMVPVLVTAPFVELELARVVEDCGASVVVSPPALTPSTAVAALVTTPFELEARAGEPGDGMGAPLAGGGVAEILYRSRPLAMPRAKAVSRRHLGPPAWPPVPLLHAFEPGTGAAQHALRLPLHHPGATAIVMSDFDPDGFCAVAASGAVGAVGLSPAMAPAVTASALAANHDLSSVRHVVLSGPAPPATTAALAAAFPGASLVEAWSPEDREPVVGEAAAAARPPWAFSQEGLIWYEQLVPGCMNLPPLVRRLAGPLDVGALEAALSELVRRHEPLRTTFETVDGRAVQVVADPSPVELEVVDLSGRPEGDRDPEVARVVRAAMSTPLDLVAGPIFRPRLLRLGTEEHVLVAGVNHAFWDDWSESVFKREMSQLYEAFLARREPSLPELPLTFGDFARAQRHSLAGPARESHLSYWRDGLRGAPLMVQLPVADPSLPEGTPQPPAAPRSLRLGPHLSQLLRDRSRELRATPFMTMLAAFVVLVHRRTGQDDVLLASVVANRERSQLHGLIGGFAKKILIRVRLDDDPAFPELVVRARSSVLGGVAHQDLPYETVLQEALGEPAAMHGLVPYVGVMFQGLASPRARLSLPGVQASRFDPGGAGANRVHFASGSGEARAWGGGLYSGTFVRLLVMETRNGYACEAWGAFHPPAVEQLLGDYRALLAEIAERPDLLVSELAPAVGGGAGRGAGMGVVDRPSLQLRGFQIDGRRLEAAMTACPGIEEAGVALRRLRPGDEQLVAYVVPSDRAVPDLAQLRTRIWSQLPGYAWPAALETVSFIPRLADGTADPAGLPTPPPGGNDTGGGAGFVAPRTPVERLLAACWAEVLGLDEMSVTESYWQRFSFLEAVALARQAGLSITSSDIAGNRTVEALAAAVSARRISEGQTSPLAGDEVLENGYHGGR